MQLIGKTFTRRHSDIGTKAPWLPEWIFRSRLTNKYRKASQVHGNIRFYFLWNIRAHLQRHIPSQPSCSSTRWKSITKSISSSIYRFMHIFNTLHYDPPYNHIIAMMQHYLQQQKVLYTKTITRSFWKWCIHTCTLASYVYNI